MATLGPLVHQRDRTRAYHQWVTGKPSSSPPEDIEAVFSSYMARNPGVEAVRRPEDPCSSDELGRRAGGWFARDWKALTSGGTPWGLLYKEIMDTGFEFLLRAGGAG